MPKIYIEDIEDIEDTEDIEDIEDIELYLNGLPEDTDEINISYFELDYIPASIIRFTQLKTLYCDNNRLTTLPILPASLKILYCGNNYITHITELPQSLIVLYCKHNHLTYLPKLPDTLEGLYCDNNFLNDFPDFPPLLQGLTCHDNRLPFPAHIQSYVNNPNIYYIGQPFTENPQITKIRKLKRFREKYYIWKYKAKLHAWMWRVRERIAFTEWHPDRMRARIEAAGGDLDVVFGY